MTDFHHSELKDVENIDAENVVTQINPKIWISNERNARNTGVLKKHAIKAILHFGDKKMSSTQMAEYKKEGIVCQTIVIEDKLRERLSDHFETIWNFMALYRSNIILFACSNGSCRAPAAVLYYLVRKIYHGPEIPKSEIVAATYAKLKTLRPCLNVNQDFLNQIQEYEARARGKVFTPVVVMGRDFLIKDGGVESLKTDKRDGTEVVVNPED